MFPLLQLDDDRVIGSRRTLPRQDDIDPFAGSGDLAFDAHAEIIRDQRITQDIADILQ